MADKTLREYLERILDETTGEGKPVREALAYAIVNSALNDEWRAIECLIELEESGVAGERRGAVLDEIDAALERMGYHDDEA